MKKIFLLPAFVLSLAVTHASFADSHKSMSESCACMKTASAKLAACPRMHEMMKDLKLTPAQQTQLKALKMQNKDTLVTQKKALMAIRGQMNALVTSEKFDEVQMDKLIAEKAELMKAMMKTKYRIKHQMYQLLDEKQKATFTSEMQQKKQMHRHMHKMNAKKPVM